MNRRHFLALLLARNYPNGRRNLETRPPAAIEVRRRCSSLGRRARPPLSGCVGRPRLRARIARRNPAIALTVALLLLQELLLATGERTTVVQGYTDSQGRHYPRLPGPLLDYYNSADGDVSNQISRHHNLPAVPYTRHNRWRHRPAYNDRSEEGVARGRGGRGGRRRGNRDPAAAARRDQRRCAASPPGRPGGRRRRQRAVATGAAASQDVQWGAVSIPHRGRQRHCCSVLRGQPQ
ncbi:Protein of unknown function, partial [Gryllus bimaculatus]